MQVQARVRAPGRLCGGRDAGRCLQGRRPRGRLPPLVEARVLQAKLAAADAADLAARTAIQVHGAIGYSWELDLQFYAKRAWALAVLNGDRNQLQRRVQELLFGGGIETGPDRLFTN